jgi:RimJ/RimL family protein N-acetyltransferase
MITTERLVLRPHTLKDLPALAAMWSDPDFVRHIIGRPATREETWARLLRYAGHWALKGFGYWAATTKDGVFAGDIGFMNFERDMSPNFGETPEMGWSIAPALQGQGYAFEAGRAALAWADAHFGRARIVCMIAPENAPSLRIAGKLGFRQYAQGTYKDAPALLFERKP